ncbi:cellulose-binding domain-containing protein, partial [Myxococcota bacterium]|nr:cellulose-binding domain-containing protein [Myxococcota bacterium]
MRQQVRRRKAFISAALLLVPGFGFTGCWDSDPCRVEYQLLSEWDGGVSARFRVQHLGEQDLGSSAPWFLALQQHPYEWIDKLWGGRSHYVGDWVVVTPEDWNQVIESQGWIDLGFTSEYSEAREFQAHSVILNGTVCDQDSRFVSDIDPITDSGEEWEEFHDPPPTGEPDEMVCTGTAIFRNDFDDDTPGVYADVADWNDPSWTDGLDEGRAEIFEDREVETNRFLRIHYPEGGVGPQESGAQWKTQLGGVHEELYLSYRLRFGEGFNFVRGGKLPGLIGGSAPTGCREDENGFSARGMWRAEGTSYQYVYWPGKSERCGDNYIHGADSEPFIFEPGIWYRIEHHLKMN